MVSNITVDENVIGENAGQSIISTTIDQASSKKVLYLLIYRELQVVTITTSSNTGFFVGAGILTDNSDSPFEYGGSDRKNDLSKLSTGGFYIDADKNVYAVDRDNHRVVKWAAGAVEGVVVAGNSINGGGLNQLSYPSDVYVDSQKNIYVLDRNNHQWLNGPLIICCCWRNRRGSNNNQINDSYKFAVDVNQMFSLPMK